MWAKVVELNKENQKIVVMYDADIVGWEQRPWEGWYGEGLEEVNMVLEWSSNELGGFC